MTRSMIHLTPTDRVDSILASGLLADREPELSAEASWTLQWYGLNPVFLARADADFVVAHRGADWRDHAEFEVDASGLPLVADLACLIDMGAKYDEAGYLYWRSIESVPAALRDHVDEHGWIGIGELLDTDHPASAAAVEATGTAACLDHVPKERLSLQARSPSPFGIGAVA